MKEMPFRFPAVSAEESFITYVIQPEDTLLSIAEKYRISCHELAALNPGTSLFEIAAGKTLRIPDR